MEELLSERIKKWTGNLKYEWVIDWLNLNKTNIKFKKKMNEKKSTERMNMYMRKKE